MDSVFQPVILPSTLKHFDWAVQLAFSQALPLLILATECTKQTSSYTLRYQMLLQHFI